MLRAMKTDGGLNFEGVMDFRTKSMIPNEENYITVHQGPSRVFYSQLLSMAGYLLLCLVCLGLIVYLRFNRRAAHRGDEKATQKLILPAFEPLLWTLVIATACYVAFFSASIAFTFFKNSIPKLVNEAFYSGRQFVFMLVIILMLQKSVSIQAIRRTVLISLVLSTYNMLTLYLLLTCIPVSKEVRFWLQEAFRLCLTMLFIYVLVKPPNRASKGSLQAYCSFVLVYDAISLISNFMTYFDFIRTNAVLAYLIRFWCTFCPLLIWQVLKADTAHWRGMGQRACSLLNIFRDAHPMGDRISSRGIHVLIEMHRKFIIDFAHMDLKKKIGIGSNAIVFNGLLHSKIPVAVKVYTPRYFTEETVAEFSHEAALCATLCHPNVVVFYGMCISPPTICLVSELCQGSLEDITRITAQRERPSQRQQVLINIAYMLDAARAVAYMHSFTPPFLHRDVKPANFLVDIEHNVKLSDFGESRSLPRDKSSEFDGDQFGGSKLFDDSFSRTASYDQPPAVKMTVTGTVDYMAPEMISRTGLASYGEAVDVYSLAITFWDIAHPGQERYPDLNNNHFLVFENVRNGYRPVLSNDIHPKLRDLIESGWQTDAALRPSARQIVFILEGIQEEIMASFALEMSDDMHNSGQKLRSEVASTEKCFTGEYAVARMEELQYVESIGEGIRLGNALMDAGFLHHLNHSQSFESTDSMYYFDDENIQYSQPLAILQERDEEEDDENSTDKSDDLRFRAATSPHTTDTSSGGKTSPSFFQHIRSGLTPTNMSFRTSQSFYTSQDLSRLANSSVCPCKRLGQRLKVSGRYSRRHRHQHHRMRSGRLKCSSIDENENTLLRSLLNEDGEQQCLESLAIVA